MDYNSTTPIAPVVIEKMADAMKKIYANPSGLHHLSRDAMDVVNSSREKIMNMLGAGEGRIVYTGSGTESDNLGIIGFARSNKNKGRHIITSSIEHPGVLNACKYLESTGFDVTYLPVNSNGEVEPEALENSIRKDTILVSVMYANNETGVIQPIKELVEISHRKGIEFHTDAVQAAGKLRIDVKNLGVDMLSISAHKFYGPKGVGALYIRDGINLDPIIYGGGHEFGLRSGTLNVPGIVGMETALDYSMKNFDDGALRIRTYRDELERHFLESIKGLTLNGGVKNRVFNTFNVTIPGVKGGEMVVMLELYNIFVSSGSACSSKKKKPSHVLISMGLTEKESNSSLRFSLGKFNTHDDVEKAKQLVPYVVERVRNTHARDCNKVAKGGA